MHKAAKASSIIVFSTSKIGSIVQSCQQYYHIDAITSWQVGEGYYSVSIVVAQNVLVVRCNMIATCPRSRSVVARKTSISHGGDMLYNPASSLSTKGCGTAAVAAWPCRNWSRVRWDGSTSVAYTTATKATKAIIDFITIYAW